MSDPPPPSARKVMQIGEAVTVVVVSFAAARRSIDCAMPDMAQHAPVDTDPLVADPVEQPRSGRRGRGRKAAPDSDAAAPPIEQEQVVAPVPEFADLRSSVTADEPAPAASKPSSRKAAAKKVGGEEGRRRFGAGRAGSCEGARQEGVGAQGRAGRGSGEESRRDEGARQEGSGREVAGHEGFRAEDSDERPGNERPCGGRSGGGRSGRAGGGRSRRARSRRPPSRPGPQGSGDEEGHGQEHPGQEDAGQAGAGAEGGGQEGTGPEIARPEIACPEGGSQEVFAQQGDGRFDVPGRRSRRRRLTCGSPPGTSTRCALVRSGWRNGSPRRRPTSSAAGDEARRRRVPGAVVRGAGLRVRALRAGAVERGGDPVEGRPRRRRRQLRRPTSTPIPMPGSSPPPVAACASAASTSPTGDRSTIRTTRTSCRGSIGSWPTSTPTPNRSAAVLVGGDFNIAPADRDVYDPAKFVGATHVSEPERERLEALERWGLVDVFRSDARRRPRVLVVGLPRGRLPPGSRPAHRPGACVHHRSSTRRRGRSSTATPARGNRRATTRR